MLYSLMEELKANTVHSPQCTLEDEKEINKLQIILHDEFKVIENERLAKIVIDVLRCLHRLIKEWVYNTALKRRLSMDVASKAGGDLYISGSFRLGIHESTSDIDALCVVPTFVDRDEDFFGDFLNTLKTHPDIKELRGIKDAYVPLIKMKFFGLDIDLLFARLRFDAVNNSLNDIKDDSILTGCDDQSISSLNAYRNNDIILSLVPNQEVFKMTLQLVKMWAKRRNLYSSKIGYLGGISWAILTAKVCQLFPSLPPNQLLQRFFSVFDKWDWHIPVLLCNIKEPVNLSIKQWNPKLSEGDQQQVMPIITPAFPCVNSAFNVCKITKKIIIEEFHRAAKLTKKRNAPGFNWMQVYKKYDPFKNYAHFFRVDALSSSPEEHLKWSGFVESKFRLLIQELEIHSQNIVDVRPCPKAFHTTDIEYECCTTFLCALKFHELHELQNYNQEYVIDLRAPILKFCEKIMGLCHREEKSTNMRITHAALDKLPIEVFEGGLRPMCQTSRRHSKNRKWIHQEIERGVEELIEDIAVIAK
jgi:poly(A) polymerase